jgi:hypothetical protein
MSHGLDSKSVTLNLFQGPFLARPDGFGIGESGAAAFSVRASARLARWVLKQVQHDEEGNGSVIQ